MPFVDSLYNTAYRMTRNAEDAEDLVQETYLQGVQVLRQVRGRHEPQGLALQDPQEHVHQQLPEAKLEPRSVDFAEIEDSFERIVRRDASGASRGPGDGVLLRASSTTTSSSALDSLPYDYRMVVLLADLEDFSYKEIAEILDCPVGTVMSRLYRGRKLLEKALLKYARKHGYIRGAEPTKMRTRPKPQPA